MVKKRGMKVRKRRILYTLAVMVFFIFSMMGCGSDVEPSDVSKIDDLPGKKIGVQIGTTGDVYVSDYEGDEFGTTVERYNKGNDNSIGGFYYGSEICAVAAELIKVIVDRVAAESPSARISNRRHSVIFQKITPCSIICRR